MSLVSLVLPSASGALVALVALLYTVMYAVIMHIYRAVLCAQNIRVLNHYHWNPLLSIPSHSFGLNLFLKAYKATRIRLKNTALGPTNYNDQPATINYEQVRFISTCLFFLLLLDCVCLRVFLNFTPFLLILPTSLSTRSPSPFIKHSNYTSTNPPPTPSLYPSFIIRAPRAPRN